MSLDDQARRAKLPAAPTLTGAIRAIIGHRWVQVAVALWLVAYGVTLWLAQGALPFDRPALAALPFAVQIAAPTAGMIEIFVLMLVTFLLTRKRAIPDMVSRAPEYRVALKETLCILAYAALGQIGGWMLGPALGYRPFSFHIAGTVFGCSIAPQPAEFWIWSLYNLLVFAVAPYLYFRKRYSNTQLNLRSADKRNDTRVILVILVLESAFTLSVFDLSILNLSARQMLLGAPLTLVLYLVGTVLPTMVLIYAVLLPRYLRLTGSNISTVILGGLTYAAMHIVEGWSTFASPTDTSLSLIFVLLTYIGPGMMKSVLTLRTGNAWVHAVCYHSIAPHVIVDTPLVVKAFSIA